MGPKLCQQIILLGGIGTLQTAEVAQIMAFPHEFRRRELHCRPWRRGETRGDLGKAGHEVDRRDDKSEAEDRKSTRLNSITNAHLVCRLLLEKKKQTKNTTRSVHKPHAPNN